MTVLKTIDAHVGGAPLRLVLEGFPSSPGRTMGEKRAWAARHADHLRRILLFEPRGHTDLCAAALTEPTSPGSHAGLLFMTNDGFSAMSAHGAIAATTIALERGLIMPGGDGRSVTFDTPAGTIRVSADRTEIAESSNSPSPPGRVTLVSFVNVPAFVVQAGVEVKVGPRRLRADVAFGGAFYAIVDGESAGLPLDPAHIPELRRAGRDIKKAVDAMEIAVHSVDSRLSGIEGTIFTGPPRDNLAHLRNVTVFGDGALDRSACGTGIAAIMAVLDAMGLLDDSGEFVSESILGTTLQGRVAGRTDVANHPAILAAIQGRAWITGEHAFHVDPDDPMRNGYRLS